MSAAVGVSLAVGLFGCPKQHRRSDPNASTGEPSENVEPAGDPRFPGEDDSDRTGFWVDQPTRTGGVSPTRLANAVARNLPKMREKCCRNRRCRGFEGRMLVKLVVAPNGEVRKASISETSIYDRDFQKCLERTASGWKVPKPTTGRETEAFIAISARIAASPSTDRTDESSADVGTSGDAG